jgi:hypothetical protein
MPHSIDQNNPEVRRQKANVRGQKAEGRRQTSEVRRQKAEDRVRGQGDMNLYGVV